MSPPSRDVKIRCGLVGCGGHQIEPRVQTVNVSSRTNAGNAAVALMERRRENVLFLPGKRVQKHGYDDGGQHDAREVYGADLENLGVGRPLQVVDRVVSHHAEVRTAQPQFLLRQHGAVVAAAAAVGTARQHCATNGPLQWATNVTGRFDIIIYCVY